MGDRATCTARFDGRTSKGTALLETDSLIFRGEFKLTIPFKDLRTVEASGGDLTLTSSKGIAAFELGALADKWAARIRKPKSVLDKLGVKPNSKVTLLGIRDDDFVRQLTERTGDVATGRLRKDSDLIFCAADNLTALDKLERLKRSLKPNGAIWVVSLKGKQARIKDVDVIRAAIDAGLVDTKVVAFSDTRTALKLVIPIAQR